MDNSFKDALRKCEGNAWTSYDIVRLKGKEGIRRRPEEQASRSFPKHGALKF